MLNIFKCFPSSDQWIKNVNFFKERFKPEKKFFINKMNVN